MKRNAFVTPEIKFLVRREGEITKTCQHFATLVYGYMTKKSLPAKSERVKSESMVELDDLRDIQTR